jgi:paraquat-inducible protein B
MSGLAPGPHPAALLRSKVGPRRRISWIWAIPVVTLLVGAWLVYATLAQRGPLITISFETAEGLTANQSHVRHKDVDMGVVTRVALSPNLKHVDVTVRMNREAEPLLTDGARFYVVRPRFFAGSITGLQTLFSGSYIDLLPPPNPGGALKRTFIGLENPPVLQSDVPGRTFLLKADRIGSLNLGSPITFRGLDVGEVLGWDIGEMAHDITVHAFLRTPFDKYVRDNSRFWNASGVNVSLGANGVQFQLESLRSVVLGGIAFDTPRGSDNAPESAADHGFPLYASETAADDAVYARTIPFLVNLHGSVAGLSAGAPVTLHGLKVGEVTSVALVYDHTLDNVMVPVHFNLEPDRIALLDLPPAGHLDQRLSQLVQRGLRVQLESGNFLTGQKELAIDIFKDAGPATLGRSGEAFVLPSYGDGSQDIVAAASGLMSRLNDIPFAAIGNNLNQLLAGSSALVNDRRLSQSVGALQATLASTQALLTNLNRGIGPVAQRMPAMAAALEDAVKHLDRLTGSVDNGYGGDSRFNRDLSRMMNQLSDAARSIRVLADLLARHPEALIRGRTDQGSP